MRIFSLSIAVLLLSACASNVRSDVTRFHHSSISGGQKTFVFLPMADQINSLEYQRYADLILSELSPYGFSPVMKKSAAQYGVTFNYLVDNGRTKIDSYPAYSTVGVGSYGRGVNVGVGGVFNIPIGNEIETRTEFTRRLNVEIINLNNQPAQTSKIFEGTATSRGKTGSFAAVSHCLIKALFKDFPGKNGETIQVAVPMDECVFE